MIRLTVTKGDEVFGEFEFEKDKRQIFLGRVPENDIPLAMENVSRKHAVIERSGDGYIITDTSSSQTLVNGARIDTTSLSSGDEIEVAPYHIRVYIVSDILQAIDAKVAIESPKRWDVPFAAELEIEMTDDTVERIMLTPPFSDMDESKFPGSTPLQGVLRNDARLVHYEQGDIVIRQGDYGNSAFFILSGSVRVVLDGLSPDILGRRKRESKGIFEAIAQLWKNSKEPEYRDTSLYTDASRRESIEGTRVFIQDVSAVVRDCNTARIDQGDVFGEIAALSRTPRTATVIAEEDCELLEIRWQGLRQIRKSAPEFKEYLDHIYRERALRVQIKETPMFQHLNDEELSTVVENTIFETSGDFEWYSTFKRMAKTAESAAARLKHEPIIAEEGHYPDAVVLIRSGFARLSQKMGHGHRTLAYLGRGHVYGFEEVAHNWRVKDHKRQVFLQRTLRAVGYTDLLMIPTKIMEEIVLPSLPPDKLPELITPYREEEKQEQTAADKIGGHIMEQLVEGRYINGTASMLINLERCTRCDDCVRACSLGHDDNPRFIRHGHQIDKFMVANACMHCADPVCMLGCPTGAIHRDSFEGQVVINDITCIGCATCANSCPYDNIRMVDIRDDKGNFVLSTGSNKPIVKATKCDLCVDQLGGPACERACPHDALKRIDLTNLDLLAKWINR